ncbi:hypothetical protein ACSSS7_003670 [Eimeria intestinalis]
MPPIMVGLLLGSLWGAGTGVCEPLHLFELQFPFGSRRNLARAEATKLLREFESDEQVAKLLEEEPVSAEPAVLIGSSKDCPLLREAAASGFLKDPEDSDSDSQRRLPSLVVNIDHTGRPWNPSPKVMRSHTPYYGHKGALTESCSLPPVALEELKRTVDLTYLGLDMGFNPIAFENYKVCNNLFFSSIRNSRHSSDPTCIIAHLDDSGSSIKALDTSVLKPLHPSLKTALSLASIIALTKQKREWIRRLLTSTTLRLAWHVVEIFSEMNINMLEANVGEALNNIVLQDSSLMKPLEELIRFATTCVTYEDYPEKSCQDPRHYPSPDNPKFKNYPIYDYLRTVGAEVSFPKTLPSNWQPHIYDGNRTNSRAAGERDPYNFYEDWKKQVYNSWHNLWVLNLVVYDAGSMWHWSRQIDANTFFFKPWRVTRVGTLVMAEAGPLRYDNLSPRFRVDPSVDVKEEEYATCPWHLTDLGFFDKLHLQRGKLTAQWHRQDVWRPTEHCPLNEAAVPCPPKVHPDKCGTDGSYIRPVESPWFYRLEREESWVTWDTGGTHSDYVDRIWTAKGTAFPKLWLLNSMSESATEPELSPSGKGRIHAGFLFLFQQAAKQMVADDVKEVAQKIAATGKRHVVLFTGHSLGGAVAQIAAWYYATKARELMRRGLLQLRCVTFGAPAWGNEIAYDEFMSTGTIIHDVATNMDPVTTLNGEPSFGHDLQWRKPFHIRRLCVLSDNMKVYASIQIPMEDMATVVVASSSPREPDFFGELWTRKELHTGSFFRRTFGALANMQNVDSVFLNPVLTHFLSYSAVLTIMADLVPEAGYGSGLAAPLLRDPPLLYASHQVNAALIEAQTRLRWVLHRIAGESGLNRKHLEIPVEKAVDEPSKLQSGISRQASRVLN